MKRVVVWTVVSVLLGAWLVAQPPGPVAKIYQVKVKPGMSAQFEEAYKKHIDWHRQQNDPWAWEAWQYQSGDLAGHYAVVTPGHHWADFDGREEMDKADAAHAAEHLDPLIESLTVWWSVSMPDLSRMPEDQMAPVPVARVTDYRVKPGKGYEFVQLIGKANKALTAAEWGGPVLWTQNVTGEAGTFSLIEWLPSWSALAPPETTVLDAMAGQLGTMAVSNMAQSFWNCVESAETHIVTHRPDLSYAPSGQ